MGGLIKVYWEDRLASEECCAVALQKKFTARDVVRHREWLILATE